MVPVDPVLFHHVLSTGIIVRGKVENKIIFVILPYNDDKDEQK